LNELNIYGCITDEGYVILSQRIGNTRINANMFSTIARPTTGIRRSSIWLQRTRDDYS
jgi:hypothetical protein